MGPAIPYDPSRRALYSPELSEPPADFTSSWDVDWICAELSRLAYYRFETGDKPRLDAALNAAGFTKAATFQFAAAGAEAIATTAGDTAFVAFRGTQPDDLRDLIADARANLVDFLAGGRVHAGFLAAWRSLEAPITEWLGETGAKRLVVTGHSLGAAMATIAAAVRPEAELVSFGSPRVGNADFAMRLAGRKARRYVDCTDFVTRVPPELLGYAHVGPALYLDRFGALREPAPPDSDVARDRWSARAAYALHHAWKLWKNVLVRDLADHAPVNYVSAVTGRRARD